MQQEEKLSLSEMAQGAFMEQFNIELNKVLANIVDPNTDPKKPRKITLTAILKANEEREVATFEVQSKAALVPVKPVGTMIIIDRDAQGKVVAAELKSGVKGQTYFDGGGEMKDDKGNVIKITQNKASRS
jgi:hypothetical protein